MGRDPAKLCRSECVDQAGTLAGSQRRKQLTSRGSNGSRSTPATPRWRGLSSLPQLRWRQRAGASGSLCGSGELCLLLYHPLVTALLLDTATELPLRFLRFFAEPPHRSLQVMAAAC
jgi:hypothetical protein